jgi:hypothetical protein
VFSTEAEPLSTGIVAQLIGPLLQADDRTISHVIQITRSADLARRPLGANSGLYKLSEFPEATSTVLTFDVARIGKCPSALHPVQTSI